MYDIGWAWKVITIVFAISLLAYLVPGMILRAIRDFKRRYGKGEADVREDSETKT